MRIEVRDCEPVPASFVRLRPAPEHAIGGDFSALEQCDGGNAGELAELLTKQANSPA
jgi:hypothetical protein